jgi:CheY-like chemotaxis protein
MATTLQPSDRGGGIDLHPIVLVAEDSDDEFLLLQRAFQQATVCAKIVRARDGAEGRDYLESRLRSGQSLPTCAVVDLRMPGVDGFELLRFIKATPALLAMPVIVLSVSKNPDEISRAYQAGANSFIVKPVQFDELVAITQALNAQWFRSNQRPNRPETARRP